MWKRVSVVLFLILIGSNGFLIYGHINLMGINKYIDMENYDLRRSVKALVILADETVIGLSKESAIQMLNRKFPESKAFVKEQGIHNGSISLAIDSAGFVTGVRSR